MRDQKQEIYQKYAKLICNSSLWRSAALSLYAAAEQLEPEIKKQWKDLKESSFVPYVPKKDEPFQALEYQRVYLMLVAYSLENLMKGFCAYKFKSEFFEETSTSGTLPKMLKTHNLKKLAENCPLELSDTEHKLLNRLSRHSEWIGRYHFPTTAKEFYNLTGSNKIPSTAQVWSSGEIDDVRAIVTSIAEQLGTSLKQVKAGN